MTDLDTRFLVFRFLQGRILPSFRSVVAVLTCELIIFRFLQVKELALLDGNKPNSLDLATNSCICHISDLLSEFEISRSLRVFLSDFSTLSLATLYPTYSDLLFIDVSEHILTDSLIKRDKNV